MTGAGYRGVYKHLVIVHGIGDQVPNETSLNFMNQFLRSLPQGDGFRLEVDNLIETVEKPRTEESPRRFDPSFAVFTNEKKKTRFIIGFSEVYWQDITGRYLKRFKQAPPIPIFTWAHSINTRLPHENKQEFFRARTAIDNLEKVLILVDKSALLFRESGQFMRILNRFLGDVEMYVESREIKQEVDERFKAVLQRVPDMAKQHGHMEPEIYVIAHSEGTIVSYSSLVAAACAKATWFPFVKGLVTLGSPLDKHYTIWKKRFTLQNYGGPALSEDSKIRWYNYWDISDPVGYGLNVLFPNDDWSDAQKLFRPEFDAGFARYPIPGLAHVGYWDDRQIHEHLSDRVMQLGTTRKDTTPRSKWFEPIQPAGDWVTYLAVRLAAVAGLLFFLSHLLGPVKALLSAWLTGSPGVRSATGMIIRWIDRTPFSSQSWNQTFWVVGLLATCKVLWEPYARLRGAPGKFFWVLRSLVWVAWLAVMARVAFRFAGGELAVKDVIGYLAGLAGSLLAWQIHTRVHRGLVQMWRYSKGIHSALDIPEYRRRNARTVEQVRVQVAKQ
jgi:hypothetical protein